MRNKFLLLGTALASLSLSNCSVVLSTYDHHHAKTPKLSNDNKSSDIAINSSSNDSQENQFLKDTLDRKIATDGKSSVPTAPIVNNKTAAPLSKETDKNTKASLTRKELTRFDFSNYQDYLDYEDNLKKQQKTASPSAPVTNNKTAAPISVSKTQTIDNSHINDKDDETLDSLTAQIPSLENKLNKEEEKLNKNLESKKNKKIKFYSSKCSGVFPASSGYPSIATLTDISNDIRDQLVANYPVVSTTFILECPVPENDGFINILGEKLSHAGYGLHQYSKKLITHKDATYTPIKYIINNVESDSVWRVAVTVGDDVTYSRIYGTLDDKGHDNFHALGAWVKELKDYNND